MSIAVVRGDIERTAGGPFRLAQRLRPAEQIALAELDAQRLERQPLGLRLDALCDDLDADRRRE